MYLGDTRATNPGSPKSIPEEEISQERNSPTKTPTPLATIQGFMIFITVIITSVVETLNKTKSEEVGIR